MLHITVQRKYARRKRNLNAELIKLNLYHGTVIHLALVILLSSDLQAILTQIEIKRQATKRRLSGLDYLTFDM